MKAAVLTEFKNIAIQEREQPHPSDDEVVVQVAYSGVCGSDVHAFLAHHPAVKPPLILGHEFSGRVVEIERNAKTELAIGDPVVVQPYTSCGRCELCRQGRDNVCADIRIFGIHTDGCFAEYVTAPINRTHKIPKEVDLKLAALTEPLAVAVHDVRKSGFKVGQSVFIIGGGPIGMLIALVARLGGASSIVLSEINPYRKQLLESMGFEALDPSQSDIVQEIAAKSYSKGFDVVFEVSGTEQGTALMTDVAKRGGTIMVVGIPARKYPVDTDAVFKKELHIQGVRIHAPHHFTIASEMIITGTLNSYLENIITQEFTLDEVGQAIQFSLQDAEHYKLLIKH